MALAGKKKENIDGKTEESGKESGVSVGKTEEKTAKESSGGKEER